MNFVSLIIIVMMIINVTFFLARPKPSTTTPKSKFNTDNGTTANRSKVISSLATRKGNHVLSSSSSSGKKIE